MFMRTLAHIIPHFTLSHREKSPILKEAARRRRMARERARRATRLQVASKVFF